MRTRAISYSANIYDGVSPINNTNISTQYKYKYDINIHAT